MRNAGLVHNFSSAPFDFIIFVIFQLIRKELNDILINHFNFMYTLKIVLHKFPLILLKYLYYKNRIIVDRNIGFIQNTSYYLDLFSNFFEYFTYIISTWVKGNYCSMYLGFTTYVFIYDIIKLLTNVVVNMTISYIRLFELLLTWRSGKKISFIKPHLTTSYTKFGSLKFCLVQECC